MIHHDLIRKHGNAGGVISPYTTWDPLNKSAPIVLSNNNLTATLPDPGAGSVSNEMVRSVLGVTTGKKYCEMIMGHGGVGSFGCGVCSQDFPIGGVYFSSSLECVAYYGENGNLYHNGLIGSNANGFDGERIRIALDVDAETITFWRVPSETPLSPGASFSFSIMSDNPTLYLMVGGDAATGGYSAELILDPADWQVPAPLGYTSWLV